jgi:hypothetical protein
VSSPPIVKSRLVVAMEIARYGGVCGRGWVRVGMLFNE